jgi:hypothetical protein
MKVFIPRIPMPTTRGELKHFIEDEMNSWFHIPFTDETKVLTYDVLEIVDQNGVREHHGLVTVEPDGAAEKVIDHLSGKRLHGKQVFLRQYHERNSNRAVEWSEERRRSDLTITKVASPHFEGIDQAVQSHGR